MLCPLVALTEVGIRKGVVGIATNPYITPQNMVAVVCCLSVSQSRSFSMAVTLLVLS